MVTKLVKQLKENDQDFEFYPTTKEIVETIYRDLGVKDRNRNCYDVLDIGCGNGNFFTKMSEIEQESIAYNKKIFGNDSGDYMHSQNHSSSDLAQLDMRKLAGIRNKYAIEKSSILLSNLPKDVIVVGTDFYENTLIDKKVDVIFSNPPYSEYERWAVKIIQEGYANRIYLVIPERWKNSEAIKSALKNREFVAEVIGNFDFLEGERAARAKVEIIRIAQDAKGRDYNDYYFRNKTNDPFEGWFKANFKAPEKEKYTSRSEELDNFSQTVKNELVEGRDLIQALASLYNKEMDNLMSSYSAISQIDHELLKELGVSVDNLCEGLRTKIKGLKYKYWHELFNNLKKITSKLTSSNRRKILEQLQENTSVDFTESNAYAIVIWVIKNANQYFDDQLKEMYIRLTEPEYIKNYKSNQKTWQKSGWRYNKSEHSHYSLEYRIVTQDYVDYRGHSDLIGDIETIAANLGFSSIGEHKRFKNGNVHFKFDAKFLTAFNIEAARLFGWLHSKEDVVNELVNVTREDAERYFKSNFLLEAKNAQLLLQ
jgi:SAM-dependent methyltransferase